MTSTPLLLATLLGLLGPLTPVVAAQDSAPFPTSTPEDQDLDPEALELISEEVERLLATDALVGAELHIIQNRHTVFHRAYGIADREEARPLKINSIFCVRSMTKPLVGTAIQMLLDEGKLTLDTTAAEILPAYDTPTTSMITIEHLLTHTTGLPFTTISGPLSGYATIGDVAAEAATTKLLFKPGTGFQYSDAGSDTLGAIVAALTGKPVEDFIQERILDPLSMNETLTLLEPGSPALARIPSAYSGSTGAWMRHWKPSDAPIFSLFLTSQSLYSTTTDYARFLALWMDGGRKLLSSEAIERGLTPREVLPSPTGFEGLQTYYGQQWVTYASAKDKGDRALFGHSGSDGTWAWAWPDRDLIVLYFTQTRGSLSGLDVEHVLDRVLIQDDLEGYREEVELRAQAAAEFTSYEGLYWDQTSQGSYYVVQVDKGRLTIDRPGAFLRGLLPTEKPGHFRLEGEGSTILQFETPVNGVCAAFLLPGPGQPERQVRHQPQPDLPDFDSIADALYEGHGLDAQEDVGTIRMTGKFQMKTRGLEGSVEYLFDSHRLRIQTTIGGGTETAWITEDGRVYTQNASIEPTEIEGILSEQRLLAHPLRRLSDWRDNYEIVEVLKTVENRGGSEMVLVRTVSPLGASSSHLVNLSTGNLVAHQGFETLPGVGRIGLRSAFGDFRDVDGLLLPFQIQSRYAYSLIGEVLITFETVETGVDAEEELQPPVDD